MPVSGGMTGVTALAEHPRASRRRTTCQVAVVGAGPYGLAAAARLRGAPGLDVRIFGKPMSFWESMPIGMLLRSAWDSFHIGYPSGKLTLDAYKAASGRALGKPVPLDVFIDYVHWSGAEVEVLARAGEIIWLRGGTIQRKLGRAKPLFYAQTDVGPAGLSRLVAVPALFTRLPRRVQTPLAHRSIRAAGARWLVDR